MSYQHWTWQIQPPDWALRYLLQTDLNVYCACVQIWSRSATDFLDVLKTVLRYQHRAGYPYVASFRAHYQEWLFVQNGWPSPPTWFWRASQFPERKQDKYISIFNFKSDTDKCMHTTFSLTHLCAEIIMQDTNWWFPDSGFGMNHPPVIDWPTGEHGTLQRPP